MLLPPASELLCTRAMYCLLTVFHVSMYFSMHCVKQPSSFLESEEPGLGTHLSKQWLLTFCYYGELAPDTMKREGKGMKRVRTVMRRRALLTAASCLIWLRMAVLGSEEEEKLERSIFWIGVDYRNEETEGWDFGATRAWC